jgi:DNA mismatch repair protein MutL
MSKIRILPDILSNKIAAGEVVERPASVVKELAENALDAGAARLLIDIAQGGRTLIRVADDGCGMSRDDALLSIERHATSKIASDQDLFNIRTLGFRGEALPSIAAVSKLSLVSRDAGSDSGTELTIEGGRLVNVAETGAPVGTLVTVRQLFFNTPARRKFLKSIATEMAHIADILASLALAWPQVHFRLTHNDRVVKSWPAVGDPFERAADVLGGVPRGELHPVDSRDGDIALSGWISSPRTFRKTAGGVFTLVNRRFVRDRVVQHALFQGYAQRLVKGQFPLAVLSIQVPFDQVDVNVHPAKSEVRFARPNDVHEAVRRAVAQTLYDVDRPSWKPGGFQEIKPEAGQVRDANQIFGVRRFEGEASSPDYRGGTPLPQKDAVVGLQPSASSLGLVGEASSLDDRGGTPLPQVHEKAILPPSAFSLGLEGEASSPDYRGGTPLPQKDAVVGLKPSASSLGLVGEASSLDDRGGTPLPQVHEKAILPPSAFRLPPSSPSLSSQSDLWERRGFAGMRVIGQLHDTYIICEAREGMILIDQHAAHERVLYEQLSRRAENLRVPSQALLVPETVELGFREAQALESLMPHLLELGLEVEPFGGGTVVVKSIPGFLSGREIRPLVTEMAEAAAGAAGPADPQAVLDFCRQRAACHGAIRAGQALTPDQMQTLLRQLDECGNLSHCPHGRPTWLRYDIGMIERAFKRV